MRASRYVAVALCGLLISSQVSAGIFDKKFFCDWSALILLMAVYNECKGEPKHDYDLSLNALKEHPVEWFENAVGNREILPKMDPRLDDKGNPVWEGGQNGRGILGLISQWEEVVRVIGVFAAIKLAHEMIGSCLNAIGCNDPMAPLRS